MGCVIFYFLFPAVLRACCVENHRRKNTGCRQDVTHERYRAVEGEMFMFPCLGQENPHVEAMWSRTGDEKKHECGIKFIAETQHSGRYTCLKCARNRSFHLQVLERKSLGCFQPEEGAKHLLVGAGGMVPCPGLGCSDNTDVIWYKLRHKRVKAVSEQRRPSCQHSGRLHLCQVSKHDTGVYFCDRQTTDDWIFRRAVNVTVVPYYTPPDPPTILYPDENSREEVELGRPHTLKCRVQFPIEIARALPPEAQWYVNYNMEDATPVLVESRQLANVTFQVVRVTQTAVIREVTPQHLDNTYTCIATNTIGSSFAAIRFKQRHRAKGPSLARHAVGPLLLVLGLGIVLHVKRLELQLIFRSHFGNHHKAEKEFDVFLSCAWPQTSSQSAPGTGEEAGGSGSALLEGDRDSATHRPLEVLLPQVLEEWGHRLCLLERDVLPGGAFANDVVLAIQRSQMLICVLSADYLSNAEAVFILESGLQALLLKSTPKLLLIWTNKASAAQIKPDPPLPILVQRALKVLPSLDWTSGKPERSNGNFWSSLKKSLPTERVRVITAVGETDCSLHDPALNTVDMCMRNCRLEISTAEVKLEQMCSTGTI